MNLQQGIFCIVASLLISACGGNSTKEASTVPQPVKASAPQLVSIDKNDPNVIRIAEFAALDISDDYLADVVTARKEVVQGTNYYLTILLRNRSVYDVVVYESLQGTLKLSNSKKIN